MKKILSVFILITMIITIGACTWAPRVEGAWISDYPYIEFDLDDGTGFMDVDGERIEIYTIVKQSNISMALYNKDLADRYGFNDDAEIFSASIKEKKDGLHLKIHHYKGLEVDVEIVMRRVEK